MKAEEALILWNPAGKCIDDYPSNAGAAAPPRASWAMTPEVPYGRVGQAPLPQVQVLHTGRAVHFWPAKGGAARPADTRTRTRTRPGHTGHEEILVPRTSPRTSAGHLRQFDIKGGPPK